MKTIEELIRKLIKNQIDYNVFIKFNSKTVIEKTALTNLIRKAISENYIQKTDNNLLKITKEGREYINKLEGKEIAPKIIQNKKISVNPQNAKLDSKIIAEAYNIKSDFSEELLKIANEINNNAIFDCKDRIDLREIKTITIDGETSKDLDDAISVEKIEDNYKVYVHISDVSHFIDIDSPLDLEAKSRGNSSYLIDKVYNMFPEILSNNIMSLNENEERFALTLIFIIDKEGNILESNILKSLIKSDRRLTYDYAQDILDKIEEDEEWLKKLLTEANEIKEILLKKRIENGSIEFNLNETKIILDGDGNPKDFFIAERKETHKIIEELMLLANCEVAKKLKNIKGAIYRIHDSPDKEKLDTFNRIAYNRGYKLVKDNEGNFDFQSFMENITGKADEKLLLTLLLRSMKQAVYDINNIGHFGLGFQYYTHFTSPIRRYTDLLTHRLLKLILEEDIKTLKPSMQKMFNNAALSCSKTERVAIECERALNKVKSVRFMKDKVGNEYNGIISGITKFGIFVEIEERGIEGLIRYAILKSHYRFDEKEQAAYSEANGKWFTLGDKIRIMVYKVNLKELFIDFIPSDEFDNSFDRENIIDGKDFFNKIRKNKNKKNNKNNSNRGNRGRNKSKNNRKKYKQ